MSRSPVIALAAALIGLSCSGPSTHPRNARTGSTGLGGLGEMGAGTGGVTGGSGPAGTGGAIDEPPDASDPAPHVDASASGGTGGTIDASVATGGTGGKIDASVATGGTGGKIDAAYVQPDVAPVKLDAAPVQPDTAPVKLDAAPVQPDTAPAKLDAAPVQPDTAPAKLDAAPVPPDTAPVKLDASPDMGGTGGAPGVWQKANLTNFTSYPDPGSDECITYNGCMWAGQFAFVSGKQPESWVMANNIAAIHEKDTPTYKLKTLRLRQGTKMIDVKVYDMCSDSDCGGCCTQNAKQRGLNFLIDIEKYTMQRFGSGDGIVEWMCLDCN
jgi:hypothetical protein